MAKIKPGLSEKYSDLENVEADNKWHNISKYFSDN